MNTSKLGGRTVLLRRDKEVESITSWLSEQPEVEKIIPRGWKPGGARGKTGLRIDEVHAGRLAVSILHGTGCQTAMVSTVDTDAAVGLAVKAASKYGFALPDAAKNGRPVPAAKPPLEPTIPVPGTPMRLKDAERIADDAKVVEPGRMVTEIRKITPDIAVKWLEENTANRAINENAVARYASDMRNGKWGVSEAVIAFDTKGRLINGQHRLWAVIESGVTITQHVTTGYPPEAIAYFDDGFRRDNAQVYNLTHDAEISKGHMAIARRLAGAGWRKAATLKAAEISRADIFSVLEKFRDGINYAVDKLYRSGGSSMPGIRTSGVLTVVARAYYAAKGQRPRLDEFCDVLKTGFAKSGGDSAAIVLRNWLLNPSVSLSSNIGAMEAYAKTEKALKMFLKGEPLRGGGRLYAETQEQFPLPGETVADTLPGKIGRQAKVRSAKALAGWETRRAKKGSAEGIEDDTDATVRAAGKSA